MNYQALIRLKGEKKIRKLALPLEIGRSPKAQILVNSPDLEGKSLFLTAGKESAIVVDETGKMLDVSILKKHGVKVLGMIEQGKEGILSTLLAFEKQGMSSFSENLKDVLFYGGNSKLRYSTYGLFGAALVASLSLGSNISQVRVTEDLSDTVRTLSLSQVDQNIYGNFGRFTNNPKGLKYVFNINTLEGEAILPGKLTFTTAGLDLKNELKTKLNGKRIFSNKIDEKCINSGCVKSLKISAKDLKNGTNTLDFEHTQLGSTYLVGKVKFEQLKEVDGALQNRIELFLTEATKLYEQKALGISNLIKSKKLIGKIQKIEKDYYLSNNFMDKVESLDYRVAEAQKAFIDDFWFSIDQKISFGKYRSALEDLEEMSKHFPEVTSPVGSKIIQYTKRVESFL